MKWFKHMTDEQHSEKMAELIAVFGYEGYGHYWRIVEIVAERMDKTSKCYVELPEEEWRRILKVSSKKLRSFLELFGKLFGNFQETSEKLFGKKIKKVKIEIPNLLKNRDNYTKDLEETSKKLPSKEVEVEVEVEVDKKKKNIKKKKKTDAAASSPPKNLFAKKIFEHWNLKPNLVEHREFEKFRPPIEARLKAGYTAGELCQAMDNLDFIIGSDQHFWNYSGWTLEQFLSQKNSLDRFMERNNPRVKFLKNTPEDEEERKIREWANS